MSRSGYTDDEQYDGQFALWRGQVMSSIRGKRGQAFLRELLAALDAMPSKRLIADELKAHDGAVCALGSVGLKRGLDMSKIDYDDPYDVANAFGITHQLAAEIEYENDELGSTWDSTKRQSVAETPEARWQRMRRWAQNHITLPPSPPEPVRE